MSELTRIGNPGRALRLVPPTQVQQTEDSFDEGFEVLEGEVVANLPADAKPVARVSYGKYVEPLTCSTCHTPIDAAPGRIREYRPHTDHTGHAMKYGYCEIPCPTCSGDAMVRRAARQQAELVQRIFGGADIPWKMRDWEFSSFPTTGDQSALEAVKKFAKRHIEGDENLRRGLWLGGDLGQGKTSLAVSALKMIIRASNIGLFVLSSDLFDRLRASFRDGAQDHTDELLEAVKNVPWLVLDDIGVERPTGYVIEQLYGIVSLRMQRGLYTIFTSNFTPRDLESYWTKDDAAGVAGKRIISRLKEYCVAVTVKGANLREKAV